MTPDHQPAAEQPSAPTLAERTEQLLSMPLVIDPKTGAKRRPTYVEVERASPVGADGSPLAKAGAIRKMIEGLTINPGVETVSGLAGALTALWARLPDSAEDDRAGMYRWFMGYLAFNEQGASPEDIEDIRKRYQDLQKVLAGYDQAVQAATQAAAEDRQTAALMARFSDLRDPANQEWVLTTLNEALEREGKAGIMGRLFGRRGKAGR